MAGLKHKQLCNIKVKSAPRLNFTNSVEIYATYCDLQVEKWNYTPVIFRKGQKVILIHLLINYNYRLPNKIFYYYNNLSTASVV
jgi:hypothetical protein